MKVAVAMVTLTVTADQPMTTLRKVLMAKTNTRSLTFFTVDLHISALCTLWHFDVKCEKKVMIIVIIFNAVDFFTLKIGVYMRSHYESIFKTLLALSSSIY